MAIYTTYFLCTPTGLRIESLIDNADEPDRVAGSSATPLCQLTEIEGSYEAYLVARLPPFVRARPHWAAKGLTDEALRPLCEAVEVTPDFPTPFDLPSSSHAMVLQLPPELQKRLVAADPLAVAERWAAAMSTPEHTHSASGVRLSDGWALDDALSLLMPLVTLARQATAGQRMYLLIEL
jgi:hypothetical protein